MENHQKQHIKQNFVKLVSQTTFETGVLLHLVTKGILAEGDCQLLDSITVPIKKAEKFYWMIQTRINSYEHLLEALEKTRQSEVANILRMITTPGRVLVTEETKVEKFTEYQTCQHKQVNQSILFDVRAPVRLFTGREHEVAELHKRIQSSDNKNATVISQMASVTGLGGIGKTELCRKYIQIHKNDYDENVVWINAEKEETIADSFTRLAKDVLKISTKDVDGNNKSIKSVVGDVYDYFRGKKSLFVFDNAESSDNLATFIPLTDGPFILITSRDREWEFSVNVVELNVLSEHDATIFVKKGLNIDDASQDKQIQMLVNTLQNFPLAIQQAISFIRQRRQVASYDILKYLKSYELNAEKVLSSKIPAAELNDYTKTTFTTWKMTTVSISTEQDYGRLAIKILNLLSYFAADNIPIQIFSNLSTQEDDDDWLNALQILVRYSMVNSHTEENTISIHRLVQEVNRIELRRQGNEENIIREALTLIEKSLNEKSVNHLMNAFEHAGRYTRIIDDFSHLPYKIVYKLQLNQKYNDAKKFGMHALPVLKGLYSSGDHINIIGLEYVIGQVDYHLNNYNTCLTVFKDVLQRFKLIHPVICQESLEIEYYIAAALNMLGEGQASLQILEKLNETQKTQFGESDWRVLNIIGQIYTSMQKYDDALDLYREAVRLCKKCELKIEADKSVLIITQNMATTYQEAGRRDMGISILRDIYYNVENGNKIKSALVGHNLAIYLLDDGNYEESRKIAYEVYKTFETFYGPDNFATLGTLTTIGRLKCFEGNYEEALIIYNRVLDHFRLQLGDFHHHTLNVQCDVAYTLCMTGQKEKALELVQEVSQKQTLAGLSKSDSCTMRVLIARVFESTGMHEKALDLLQQSKKQLKMLFGENSIKVLSIRQQICAIKDKMSK